MVYQMLTIREEMDYPVVELIIYKKISGLAQKVLWVERHTWYDTFYEMYTLICECLEAILAAHDYLEMYTSWQVVLCRIKDPVTRPSFKSYFLPDHYCSSDSQKLPEKCQPHCHEIAEEGPWYILGISNAKGSISVFVVSTLKKNTKCGLRKTVISQIWLDPQCQPQVFRDR